MNIAATLRGEAVFNVFGSGCGAVDAAKGKVLGNLEFSDGVAVGGIDQKHVGADPDLPKAGEHKSSKRVSPDIPRIPGMLGREFPSIEARGNKIRSQPTRWQLKRRDSRPHQAELAALP